MQSRYNKNIWTSMLDRVAYSLYTKLNYQDKCVLNHIMKGIDIDRPEGYIQFLGKLKPY